MGYSQQATTASNRSRVQILTVDSANRRIEGLFKDNSTVQIVLWDNVSSAFRMPVEGEIWMIRRVDNVWHLDTRVQQGTVGPDNTALPEAAPITGLSPGQLKLDSTSIVDADGGPLGPQPGDLIASVARTRSGCLLCDGASYSLAAHPELTALAAACPDFVVAGVLTLPDLRGRAPVGAGTGPGLTPRALGTVGGVETYALAAAESGTNGNGQTLGMNTGNPHAHNNSAPYTTGAGGTTSGSGIPPHNGVPSGGNWSTATTPTDISHVHQLSPRGADSAHPNMQPYAVVNWFVKL